MHFKYSIQRLTYFSNRFLAWRAVRDRLHLSRKFPVTSIGTLLFTNYRSRFLLCSAFIVSAFSFRKDNKMGDFQEVDKLFDDADYDGVIEKLSPRKEEANDELLWRLVRAMYQKTKTVPADADKKQMLKDAQALIERALELNESNFANWKWRSIVLSRISELEGTKEQLTQSVKVKEYMEKAVSLNPNDATCYHVLGVWCFSFADLSWLQRQAASMIFATPPTSSYEEALKFFEKAEGVNPGWYNTNLLYLGKTHLRMKNKDGAIEFLTRCRDAPVKDEDDKQANKESIELLKGLGVRS